MLASKHAHAEVVELLLGAHADASLADSAGHTALELAARRGSAKVAGLLLGSGGCAPSVVAGALAAAAKGGHVDIVKMLAANGGPVQPLLMRAAGAGVTELTLTLLKVGASPPVRVSHPSRRGTSMSTCPVHVSHLRPRVRRARRTTSTWRRRRCSLRAATVTAASSRSYSPRARPSLRRTVLTSLLLLLLLVVVVVVVVVVLLLLLLSLC